MMEITLKYSQIKAVSLAMAVNDARYYLKGILIETSGNQCNLVATDGHRLHMIVCDSESDNGVGQYIVSANTINKILKYSKKYDPVFIFSVDGINLTVTFPDKTSIRDKLVDGQYPNYKSRIPTSAPTGEASFLDPTYVYDAMSGARINKGLKPGVGKHPMPNGTGDHFIEDDNFLAIIMPMRQDVVLLPVSDIFT